MVSGNISGTWTKDGNPYMVIDNCVIQKGEFLKILPGVEVIIGDSLSISSFGRIEALGNQKEQIKFKAPNEDIYWDKIEVNYSGEISEFKYCDFSNANIAVYLKMVGRITDTMITKIQNCNFTQCDSSGLYGYVYGRSTYSWGGMRSHYPHLNPIIKNCTFTNIPNGCIFYIRGWGGSYAPTTQGHTSPFIENNIFNNISNTVLMLEIGSYAGSSHPSFVNNTVDSCKNVLITQNPYDVLVKNNIFNDCVTVIKRSGEKSSDVSYNCFYGNTVNFIGYTDSYGMIVMQNPNGDPCDIAFNIYNDPLFTDNIYYNLSNNSPCIDAGKQDTTKQITPYDLSGKLRVWDGNGDGISNIDIGALEYDAPYYEQIQICEGNNYKGWIDPGTYFDTLNTVQGMDSVIMIELIVNPSYQITENLTICEGESYKDWTETGIYTENFYCYKIPLEFSNVLNSTN